jgi:hypothetical protein
MSYDVVKADINKDSDIIIDFWNQNNPKNLDEKFAWMYSSNPDGEASTWLVKHRETSEIVGMASVFPRKFRFKDEFFIGGIQGDFFVSSKHRSFGPALMLIRALVDSLTELDYDFLFGFPNKQAELIFRRAGYAQLGITKKYIRLFNVKRLLSEKKYLPKKLIDIASPVINVIVNYTYPDSWVFNLGRFKTELSNKIIHNIEGLADLYHQETFSTNKTKEYLSWKYENDPDEENMFFFLLQNDCAVGCIIFSIEEDKFVNVKDVLHNHDAPSLKTLFALFFRHMKKTNCEYAYVQMYAGSSLLTSTNNLDMTESKQGRKVVYTTNLNRPRSAQLEVLINSRCFTLSKSDEDS